MQSEKKETFPLAWPSDWPRTRPQDQKPMSSWKRTANQYRDALLVELGRMGSPSAVISSNVPLTLRGDMNVGRVEPRDVGVAVYFSRKRKDDFKWQDTLNIHDPDPSEAQVQDAYRQLVQIHHPDRGGDLEMFKTLTEHRDAALRWIRRHDQQQFSHVIACDQFQLVRLNLAAIVSTIKAIRQIERAGTSSLLERAFAGFTAIPEHAGADAVGSR